jgi:GNAT superfamily N-acetyltransferase
VTAISVRAARAGDEEAMGAVWLAAGRRAWPHIFGEESLETLQPPVASFREQITQDDDRTILVAESDGRVVAFAVLRASPDEDADGGTVGQLGMFYSHPAVWGRGVGRSLLAAALESLRDGGYSEATLWTSDENHRPRRIYERAGWRLDGASRDRCWLGVEFREVRYRIAL